MDEETPAPVHVSPEEKLLQKTPGGVWSLGPLPEPHAVLRRELGYCHEYKLLLER